MKKGNDNKMLIILGIVAVAGVAIYMMRKKPNGTAPMGVDPLLRTGGSMDIDIPEIEEEEEEVEAWRPTNAIRIDNALGMGKYKWFSVDKSDKQKADAALQIGTYGKINDRQDCTISDFWINEAGLKAAFKCEEFAEGSYDIPGGSRFEW